MDVFQLRDGLVKDYSNYIKSFISIQDDRIKKHVDHELASGIFWPDPLIQTNLKIELKPTPTPVKKTKLARAASTPQRTLLDVFHAQTGLRNTGLRHAMNLGKGLSAMAALELAAARGTKMTTSICWRGRRWSGCVGTA